MRVLDVLDKMKSDSMQTYEHSVRVGNLSHLLAISLGMSAEEADRMKMSGYVHDVGKNAMWDIIESDIDFNSLSQEERERILKRLEKHTSFDFYLKDCEDVIPEYMDAIHYHHNKYNGTGYCKESARAQDKSLNLKGDDIPKVAQIICIVDIYDALRNPRSYKKGFSIEETMNIMKEDLASGVYNPLFANVFLEKVFPAWERMEESEKLFLNPSWDDSVRRLSRIDTAIDEKEAENTLILNSDSIKKQGMDFYLFSLTPPNDSVQYLKEDYPSSLQDNVDAFIPNANPLNDSSSVQFLVVADSYDRASDIMINHLFENFRDGEILLDLDNPDGVDKPTVHAVIKKEAVLTVGNEGSLKNPSFFKENMDDLLAMSYQKKGRMPSVNTRTKNRGADKEQNNKRKGMPWGRE